MEEEAAEEEKEKEAEDHNLKKRTPRNVEKNWKFTNSHRFTEGCLGA